MVSFALQVDWVITIVVQTYDLDNTPSCVVVGSDGLWEMLSIGVIANTCRSYLASQDALACAKDLTQKATLSWQKNLIGYVDDITCIVAFLKEDRRFVKTNEVVTHQEQDNLQVERGI